MTGKTAILIYVLLNVLVFGLYGVDKELAILQKRRIPERTLLAASIFGVIGALIGMVFFRHKIRKIKFLTAVPLTAAVEVLFLAYLNTVFHLF